MRGENQKKTRYESFLGPHGTRGPLLPDRAPDRCFSKEACLEGFTSVRKFQAEKLACFRHLCNRFKRGDRRACRLHMLRVAMFLFREGVGCNVSAMSVALFRFLRQWEPHGRLRHDAHLSCHGHSFSAHVASPRLREHHGTPLDDSGFGCAL